MNLDLPVFSMNQQIISFPKRKVRGHPYKGKTFQYFLDCIRSAHPPTKKRSRQWLSFCCKEYSAANSLWEVDHQVTKLLQFLHSHQACLDLNTERYWAAQSEEDSDPEIEELTFRFGTVKVSIEVKKQ